jgi:nicotinate-nucleotide adenylyltransferase
MNITLFGGSFNPPHIGHRMVMSQAFELAPIDEIWLLPSFKSTAAKNIDLIDPYHRLEMTKSLLNGRIKLETCEIDQKMSGETIEPVTYLIKKCPQHQFSFLMGSDQLKNFDQWDEWEKLLELIPFYIYPRVGFEMTPLEKNMIALIHPLQIITNISSTMVRDRIKAGLTVKHLVPKRVAEYIEATSLYL